MAMRIKRSVKSSSLQTVATQIAASPELLEHTLPALQAGAPLETGPYIARPLLLESRASEC